MDKFFAPPGERIFDSWRYLIVLFTVEKASLQLVESPRDQEPGVCVVRIGQRDSSKLPFDNAKARLIQSIPGNWVVFAGLGGDPGCVLHGFDRLIVGFRECRYLSPAVAGTPRRIRTDEDRSTRILCWRGRSGRSLLTGYDTVTPCYRCGARGREHREEMSPVHRGL